MKRPRGEPDDLAGSPPLEDATADDPKLDAMRAVWLAMREEEPGDKGLVDLLAAARAKATTMQPRPTLGQRLIAILRRPPALAFATVVVLVGGAVLWIGRGGKAQAPDFAAGPSGGSAMGHAEPAAGENRAGGPRRKLGTPSRPTEQVERADDRVASSASAGSGRSATPAARPPAAAAEAAHKRPADGDAPEALGGGPPVPVPEAEPADRDSQRTPSPEAPRALGAQRPETPLAPAPAHERAGRSATVAAPPPPPRGTAGRDADAAGTAPTAKRENETVEGASLTTLGLLRRQCEVAAERGDCAAVRRLVVRITSQDRGYRARIGKDSAVGRCLASED